MAFPTNISQVTFEPRYTEAELAAAVAWLRSSVTNDFNYAANFCIFGTNLDTKMLRPSREEYVNQPCHRQIKGTDFPYRSLVATECGWNRRGTGVGVGSVELFQPFFDWLTAESFMARFFVFADIDIGFVVSADVYTPLMQNIMILTRHFYEVHENGFINFNKLVQAGVPGDIAYPLAFNTSLSTKTPENSKFVSIYSHRVTHLFGLDAFSRYLVGDIGKATKDDMNDPKNHYRNRRAYEGGKDLFWDTEQPPYKYTMDAGLIASLMQQEAFRNALSLYRKGQNGGMYKAPNPFAPKPVGFTPPSANEVSNEEVLAVVGPYLAHYFQSTRTKEQ